jgi:predicted phosphodiesterase
MGMVEVRDLGVLEGPVLLFGGPYSNLQALQAMMNWAHVAQIPARRRICTGDVVAYCADAVGCIDVMRRLNSPVVAGNCEIQLAENADDCGCGFRDGSTCSTLSVEWYAYAKKMISSEDRTWLGSCPDRLIFQHEGKRYVVLHGGAGDVSRFLWPLSSEDDFWHEISILQEEIGAFDAVIADHSGIPFERWIDGVHWINAGVIGMPANDGQADTAFAVLDGGKVRFEALNYDVKSAVAAMEKAGLKQEYQETLITGFWPSEDVLPKSMRRTAR